MPIEKYSDYFKKTYKSPCGVFVEGINTNNGLSWLGTDYGFENDNPWMLCPKKCANCKLREEPFASEGDGVLKLFCIVHPTDETYDYEHSFEGIKKLKDDELNRKKISFSLEKNGRICDNHMHFNVESQEYEFNYSPSMCASGGCSAQNGGICPVLGRQLTKDKGNVYYDLHIYGRDYSKDGTLFEGEQFHDVIKGIQLYDKPINLDIANLIAKLETDHIRFTARYNRKEVNSMWAFLGERGERDYHIEVKNIRAEKKVTRDFEQDLEDIDNGIRVYHDFDERRKKKEEKSQKRKEALEKRKLAIYKKISKNGWDTLDYINKNKAHKLLDTSEIKQAITEHAESIKYDNEKPKQMSIFDYA